jgi:uncharacterized RmlC-like cupin family protein
MNRRTLIAAAVAATPVLIARTDPNDQESIILPPELDSAHGT